MRGFIWVFGLFVLAACSSQFVPATPLPKETITPTILELTPAPEAKDVNLSDPIQIKFSTAIKPETLNAQTVVLKWDNSAIESNLTLSQDGKTATISNNRLIGPNITTLSVELLSTRQKSNTSV